MIIDSILTFFPNRVRLKPTGGELRIQKKIAEVWTTVGAYAEPGNSNNEFRWKVDGTKLKVQQIKDGGTWIGGVEGVDFTTVAEHNEL